MTPERFSVLAVHVGEHGQQVALAGDRLRRQRPLDAGEFVGRQHNVERPQRFLELVAAPRAGECTTSGPRERTQANASCAAVQPLSCATARSASTSCRFFGKFSLKKRGWKR